MDYYANVDDAVMEAVIGGRNVTVHVTAQDYNPEGRQA